MPEKKLTTKEKAVKWDNWLKYVNNRGWSEILQKPLKVKAVIDKLKGDISYLDELNNGLNQACDLLTAKKKKLLEEVEKWKKSSDDFRKDIVESNKLHSKKAAEIKQLTEDNGNNGTTIAQQDAKIKRLEEQVESHKGTGIMIEKERQKLQQELKQTKADLAQSMDQVRRVLPIAEESEKKLKEIEKFANEYSERGGSVIDLLKEILDEK